MEEIVKALRVTTVLVAGIASSPVLAADNPWPALRKARIERLLPGAMSRAGIDAWLVLCRENANDPLAFLVGGENAGAPAAR